MIDTSVEGLRKDFLKTLKLMNEYIISHCDRDTLTTWNDWLVSCYTNEILNSIASNTEDWLVTCRIFHKLVEEE